MVIGEETVFAEIRKARPEIACTTPPTAALAAFKALGLTTLAVLAPYPKDVNLRVRHYLESYADSQFRRPPDSTRTRMRRSPPFLSKVLLRWVEG